MKTTKAKQNWERVFHHGFPVDAKHMFFTPVPHQRKVQEQEAVLKATAVQSPLPVMSLILPCPPYPQVMQATGGSKRVEGEGRGLGEGAGDISSTLPYILHDHMVLRPKGTSHNNDACLLSERRSPFVRSASSAGCDVLHQSTSCGTDTSQCRPSVFTPTHEQGHFHASLKGRVRCTRVQCALDVWYENIHLPTQS